MFWGKTKNIILYPRCKFPSIKSLWYPLLNIGLVLPLATHIQQGRMLSLIWDADPLYFFVFQERACYNEFFFQSRATLTNFSSSLVQNFRTLFCDKQHAQSLECNFPLLIYGARRIDSHNTHCARNKMEVVYRFL